MLLLRPNSAPLHPATPRPHTTRGWFRAVVHTTPAVARPAASQTPPHNPSPSSGATHPGITPNSPEARLIQWMHEHTLPPPSDNPPSAQGPTSGGSGRLNLLLSWAGWRPESWVNILPQLLEPMGVHSVRVTTAREAERVIRKVTVHIAIVDLGLPLDDPCGGRPPEEAGPRVLELLRRLHSPPPTVVIQENRASRDAARHMTAALRCDAFAVVDRGAADLEQMLKLLHRCMERFYQGRWPAPGSPCLGGPDSPPPPRPQNPR